MEHPFVSRSRRNVNLTAKPRNFLPVVFHLTVTVCMNAMMFLRGYFRKVHRRLYDHPLSNDTEMRSALLLAFSYVKPISG